MQPFIRNHEYNFIQKQVNLLQQAVRTVADLKVVAMVRSEALTKIADLFPLATGEQSELLAAFTNAQTAEDFQAYLRSLEAYRMEFAQLTDKQIRKLFPKNKKLRLPDLNQTDYRNTTYLGWNDIGANKSFMIVELDGQVIGVEGKFTPSYKKGYCFVCNKMSEIGLFSAISKSRPANASSDYYKAIGNYMCMSSETCNANITDTAALERFVKNVTQP